MAELSQENVQKKSDGELQLVVFNTGKEDFGIEIMNVQEIIRMTNITKIPQSPSYIRGIINLRGKIIVVINLNVVMGMESSEHDENTRIIVTSINDTVVGFVVDSVSEVLRLPSSSVEAAPELVSTKIDSSYLKGVGKLDNRLLLLLDMGRVLSKDEMSQIPAIQEMYNT